MSVDEAKVKELVRGLDVLVQTKDSDISFYISELKKLIAPEQPEGVPVLVTYKRVMDEDLVEREYFDSKMNYGECLIEIDYQRKGSVIPWHGGECPVDDKGAIVTVYYKGGPGSSIKARNHNWENDNMTPNIIAYVIWPEWVKS